MLLRWWWLLLAWDGGELWGISSSLALFLPVRGTEGLGRVGDVDVDLDPEEGVIAREKGALLRVKEARARAVRDLRCESGPHLHELVAGGRGGESVLALAVEVEFADEMEACVSAGCALWGGDCGHGWMTNR